MSNNDFPWRGIWRAGFALGLVLVVTPGSDWRKVVGTGLLMYGAMYGWWDEERP